MYINVALLLLVMRVSWNITGKHVFYDIIISFLGCGKVVPSLYVQCICYMSPYIPDSQISQVRHFMMPLAKADFHLQHNRLQIKQKANLALSYKS